MIITDDFRTGLGRRFGILPFAGCAPFALRGHNFGTEGLYFRVSRESFRN